MKVKHSVVGVVIALSMLMLSDTGALAQGGSPQWSSSNETHGCFATPLADTPFSAEAVTVWHPPANTGGAGLSAIARYYRDRDGRVRVDFVEGNSRERIIVTGGADSSVVYLLDTGARTAVKTGREHLAMIVGGGCANSFQLPLSMSRLVSFGGRAANDEQSLGKQSMAGMQVAGRRFSTELSKSYTGMAVDERWVSPELNLVVYNRREHFALGVVEYQLRNIKRTDPPAQLFDVPADYVETPWIGMSWEPPYFRDRMRAVVR